MSKSHVGENEYEIHGDVVIIFLDRKDGMVLETVINVDKLPRVLEFPGKWYAAWCDRSKTFYVQGNFKTDNGGKRTVRLHRWITNCPEGLLVDHINHNGLDNRQSNLWITDNFGNQQNRRVKSNSGISGIFWQVDRRRWKVAIGKEGKTINLGRTICLKKAIQMRKEAEVKYWRRG